LTVSARAVALASLSIFWKMKVRPVRVVSAPSTTASL
jgi:hypothetical protein